MSIQSFRIGPKKALRLAECTEVPPVMVIAGPNGVGKSTLLYDLYQRQGQVTVTDGSKLLYQGPHRAIRRTAINRRFILGAGSTYSEMLALPSLGGLEGLSVPYPNRTPDNVDEAGSTIKYSLGRMENRRQLAHSKMIDSAIEAGDASVSIVSLPDPYKPLRELTHFLLPHLKFKGVDFTSESDIKCLWTRVDSQSTNHLDLDDLSSGEKSIITLFLPLLEAAITRAIDQISDPLSAQTPVQAANITLILDEPEIHLHPDLQARILIYMRNVAKDSQFQFIMSTHSPTLLDQAYDSELYVLNPPGDDPDANQLRRVATNIERLEALRNLTGTTFVVTTGRSIVCIEGKPEADVEPADIRLFEILYPRAAAYTLVPSGGKNQVLETTTRLREFLPEEHFRIKVFGLVDSDQGQTVLPPGVARLPVCMIENFLLDVQGIHKYLVSRGIMTLDPATITTELANISTSERAAEIAIRVGHSLGFRSVRVGAATVADIKARHAGGMKDAQALLRTDGELSAIVNKATSEVDGVLAAGNALRLFRGKPILQEFYRRHVQPTNDSYGRFCYELAEVIAAEGSLTVVLDELFDQLV